MKDKEPFLQQVFAHQAIIHKICRMYRDTKEDREDLFQEIIYQLWKAYGGYRGDARITTWMYRIGLNTAMATFRKPKPEHASLEEHVALPGMADLPPEDENSERLFSAIRQLQEADRALLSLYFEDMSYAEMGEVLGISESNVGARLTRVKAKLRKQLKV
ncbi:MAG: sigma-70 family RNA polymerase sigma factor [Cyclobacteriaceae bacterium]